MIERFSFEYDDRPPIMTVQVPALSIVIEQAVPVAEVDLAADSEHRTFGPRRRAAP